LADSNTVLMAFFLLLAFVCMVWMAMISRRAKAAQVAAEAAAGTPTREGDLLKFVVDEAGNRKGETVALEGDAFILKTSEGFARVPTHAIEAQGAELKVKGDVDWAQARRDGEAWRERSHKVVPYRPEELPPEEA